MQAMFWIAAAACVLVAMACGFGEHRRRNRADLDRVGFVPWLTIQLTAIVAAILLASVAMHVGG
jgi:hypothetical protein